MQPRLSARRPASLNSMGRRRLGLRQVSGVCTGSLSIHTKPRQRGVYRSGSSVGPSSARRLGVGRAPLFSRTGTRLGLFLNAPCRGCRSPSQVPNLSPPSADTAAVIDARSRLHELAQGGRVYEFLDQCYRDLRHVDADPLRLLLTLPGVVRLGPRRSDHRQRSFLRPTHPDDGSLPGHLFRAIREQRHAIDAATGASADVRDTTIARSTKDTLCAA